jgi:hypothetical protein
MFNAKKIDVCVHKISPKLLTDLIKKALIENDAFFIFVLIDLIQKLS